MARGREGTVIGGKWRIERRIAKGGMASVYAASHVATGFRVAIKILSREATEHEESRERFLREGKLANTVDHEGVIDIIDDGVTAGGRPFLIMELLEGETLEEKRARSEGGRLDVADVAKISLAIADVLAAAHDAGIVHRDVKPLNVFLTTSGVVKLLDFGIAGKRMRSEECTMTGAGCGTPLFMAPEQITGDERIDARADVFALGATMYRLLSGRFPFAASNLVEYMHAILAGGPPKRLDTFVPGVDAALADVVQQALAREPETRFPDARAMACAIAKAIRPAPTPPASVTVALAPPPQSSATRFDDHTEVMPPPRERRHTPVPMPPRPVSTLAPPPPPPVLTSYAIAAPRSSSPSLSYLVDPAVGQLRAPPPARRRLPAAAVVVALSLSVLLFSVAAMAAWAPASDASTPRAVPAQVSR